MRSLSPSLIAESWFLPSPMMFSPCIPVCRWLAVLPYPRPIGRQLNSLFFTWRRACGCRSGCRTNSAPLSLDFPLFEVLYVRYER